MIFYLDFWLYNTRRKRLACKLQPVNTICMPICMQIACNWPQIACNWRAIGMQFAVWQVANGVNWHANAPRWQLAKPNKKNEISFGMQITCQLHANCMQITCKLHAICMQLACNLHAIGMRFACNWPNCMQFAVGKISKLVISKKIYIVGMWPIACNLHAIGQLPNEKRSRSQLPIGKT